MTQQPALGTRVRHARLALGLAQTDLAMEGMSASYVSLIEAGRRDPSPETLSKLAERLQVDVEYLATGVRRDDALQARTDLAFAKVALAEGRPEQAQALLLELLEREPRQLSDAAHFDARLALASAHERFGRVQDAISLLENLRAEAEEPAQDLPWLPVLVALARCYRDVGDSARAIDLAEAAIGKCKAWGLHAVDGHVQLVSTLAGVYAERGDLTRSGQLLDELLSSMKDDQADQRGYVYWNAAMTAADAGHRGDALRLIERAAALLSEGDDERNHARLKVARAWIMLNEPVPDALGARQLLRDALPSLRRHAGRESLAKAETELARAEIAIGRPDVAARHALKALSRLTPEQPLARARAHAALGASLIAQGKPEEAPEQLLTAAQFLSAAQAPRQAAAVWRQLAQAHRALGDADGAMQALERALDLAGIANEPLPSSGRPEPRRKGGSKSATAAVSEVKQSSSV